MTGIMSEAHAHHLLFYQRDWTARPDSKALRKNPWLVIPMEQDAHNALHAVVSYVPTLGRHVLSLVRRAYTPIEGDYVASAVELMNTIQIESNHIRVGCFEREVAEMVIESIEMQMGYIKQGVVYE